MECFFTNFTKLKENPFSQHNDLTGIRDDFSFHTVVVGNIDLSLNRIYFDPAFQQTKNEFYWADQIDGQFHYGHQGSNAALNILYRKIGISSNPAIVPHQKYNQISQRLTDFHLNGISFEIVNYNTSTGDIQLQIKYDDIDIVNDQRLTGQVQLSDIVAGAAHDLVIKSGNKLIIDHSGTPNRETRGPMLSNGQFTYPDFVTPTYLQLNSGSSLLVEDNATLIVEPKSTLIIKSGAILTVLGKGKVDVKDGAFICIEPGAILNFTDPQSRIFVRQNATIGTNPSVSLANSTTSCLDRCELQILLASNGSQGTIDHTYQNFTAGGEIIAYENATGYTLGSSTNPIGLYDWEPSQLLVNPTSPNPTIGNLTQNQVLQ